MHPWDRQPDETQKAHEAFLAYLGLEERTHEATAIAIGKSPRYRSTVSRWASRHHWSERALEHDSWLAGQRVEARAVVRVDREVTIEEARSEVYRKLRASAETMAGELVDIAAGRFEDPKATRVQLAAIKHGLAILGCAPKATGPQVSVGVAVGVEVTSEQKAQARGILAELPDDALEQLGQLAEDAPDGPA